MKRVLRAKRAASEVINGGADWLGTRFKETVQEVTAAYASGIVGAGALSAILGFGLAGL